MSGITDEMVDAGVAAVVALGCGPDGCDPECSCREFDDEDKADFQHMVRTALEGAMAGRMVVDQPEQWKVFDLQPDDVLLIGNVHGARLDMDDVTRRLRELYPERRIIFFSDDIDVTTLREAATSEVAGGDGQ